MGQVDSNDRLGLLCVRQHQCSDTINIQLRWIVALVVVLQVIDLSAAISLTDL